MTDNKKIEFAPGCFDDFDGTQQELEQLMSQLQTMFENLSTDELRERSRTVSMEDLEELDPETQQQILSALDDLDNDQRKQRLN